MTNQIERAHNDVESFTGNNVAHRRNRSGFCACGNAARPGQGNCYSCHAEAQAVYRARILNRQRDAEAYANKCLKERVLSEESPTRQQREVV